MNMKMKKMSKNIFIGTILLVQIHFMNCFEFKCNKTLGETQPLDDGTCPEKTRRNSECCIPVRDIDKDDTALGGLQGDSPYPCDRKKDQFQPLWDLSCPDGKGLDSKIHCCVPCLKCPPGYEPETQCLEPCRPCPPHHYSNQPIHNERCILCINCASLNRYDKKVCSPTSPARCGQCMEGYHEVSDENPDETRLCEPDLTVTDEVDRALNQDVMVETFTLITYEYSKGITLDLQIPMMILLSILTVLALAGFVIYVCDKLKKMNKGSTHRRPDEENQVDQQDEQKPLMDGNPENKLSKGPSIEEEVNMKNE